MFDQGKEPRSPTAHRSYKYSFEVVMRQVAIHAKRSALQVYADKLGKAYAMIID
jgi:hypothetical protein